MLKLQRLRGILAVGAMARDGRQRAKVNKQKKRTKRNQASHGMLGENIRTKQDDFMSLGLFGALVGRFLRSGENHIIPRVIQIARIGGPGKG